MIVAISGMTLFILFFNMYDECTAKIAPPADITKNYSKYF